jgi:hypothetical protein
MEDLRNAMRIIDENSDKLSEGDYLQLCNLLRNIYRDGESKEMNTLFDYESFNIYTPNQSEEILEYFHDHYYITSVDNDKFFLKAQMNYLESELEMHRPIQRISKNVKLDAIGYYCDLNNIRLTRNTVEMFKQYHIVNNLFVSEVIFQKSIHNICKSFIHIENTYRNLYRGVIMERIEKIEKWIDNLDDF